MHKRTILFLALVLLVLGGVAGWQVRRERIAEQSLDVLLFEGVDASRVSAVEVENIERDTRMRLERDALGGWRMTDPMDVPANVALANRLLESALARRGTVVPEAEQEDVRRGLEPPRIVLEIEERIDGQARESRLEIGALDHDGDRVNVRTRGSMFRTLRDLDTTLSRPLEDFRTRAALDLRPQDVVELHRTGRFRFEEAAEDADISVHMVVENGRWRATSPVSAALDPLAVSFLIQGATRLEILDYRDAEHVFLSAYGLDPEEFRIELAPLDGASRAVRLGRAGHAEGAPWNATREGQRFVWGIDEKSARLLATPLADLLDHRVVRAARERIDGLTLRWAGREVMIARRDADWFVTVQGPATPSPTAPVLAERGRVEDLLVRLERAELAGFRWAETADDAWRGDGIWVRSGEAIEGGRLGPEYVDSDGARFLRFQRDGDSLVALLDSAVAQIAGTAPEALWSLKLWNVLEVEQVALSLAGHGRVRRYVRDPKGQWMLAGQSTEARELREVLDPLLFLRAAQHLSMDGAPQLEDPLTVEFVGADGSAKSFAIGRVTEKASGATQYEIRLEGRRALVRDAELYGLLARVLELG